MKSIFKRKSDQKVFLFVALLFGALLLSNCSGNSTSNTESTEQSGTEEASTAETTPAVDPMTDKGVGPITSIDISVLDKKLAATGKSIFESKCTACHKFEARHVGPALQDITKRRSPEWIMNMILNPNEMVEKNPIAKDLLATYMSPMANQNLTKDEARAILDYFRENDSK